MPAVTRQEALKIAEDYLMARPRPNCDGIEKVYTIPELEEFMIRRLRVYNLPTKTLLQCWIAYAGRPAGLLYGRRQRHHRSDPEEGRGRLLRISQR
jgi:hypothetical protein